ncbi:MAG: hypothetical protein OHK0029_01060 [Armatimonadaceae bacterium]
MVRLRIPSVQILTVLFLTALFLTPARSGQAEVFSNTTPIIINDNSTATPYPSNIAVSGMTGSIIDLSVTLHGLSHTFPGDIAGLLVGPSGVTTSLMVGAGGADPVNGVTLTFRDDAPSIIPQFSQITTGNYQPTNYAPGFSLSGPAPAGPYGDTFSNHLLTDPNGIWSLYIQDTDSGEFGEVSGGMVLGPDYRRDNQPDVYRGKHYHP